MMVKNMYIYVGGKLEALVSCLVLEVAYDLRVDWSICPFHDAVINSLPSHVTTVISEHLIEMVCSLHIGEHENAVVQKGKS